MTRPYGPAVVCTLVAAVLALFAWTGGRTDGQVVVGTLLAAVLAACAVVLLVEGDDRAGR